MDKWTSCEDNFTQLVVFFFSFSYNFWLVCKSTCSVLSFYQNFSYAYVPTETLREFKQVLENIIYLFESNNCSSLIFFLHRAILFQIYTTSQ